MKKSMKIKFNLDGRSLRKTLKMHNVVILIRFAFNVNNKYYPRVILEKCLYELAE